MKLITKQNEKNYSKRHGPDSMLILDRRVPVSHIKYTILTRALSKASFLRHWTIQLISGD